jgi:hypothetical protein
MDYELSEINNEAVYRQSLKWTSFTVPVPCQASRHARSGDEGACLHDDDDT